MPWYIEAQILASIVSILCYVTNRRRNHCAIMKWVLHHLKGTSNTSMFMVVKNLELVHFLDVEFVSIHYKKKKGFIRHVFSLADAAVGGKTNLQFMVALSTTIADNVSYTCMQRKCLIKEVAYWIRSQAAENSSSLSQYSKLCLTKNLMLMLRLNIFMLSIICS